MNSRKKMVLIYLTIKWQCNVLKKLQEKAKKDLSGVMQTQISLPFISAGAAGPLHLELSLTRAKFDEITRDLVVATEGPVRQALSDAGMQPSEIDQVLLVGGSTRIPAVQESVKRLLGKEPNKSVNPVKLYLWVLLSKVELSLVTLKMSYY